MGATRESSWSGGIFAACSWGEAAGAEGGDGMHANESPGTMAIVQTVTSTHRKVGRQNFRFGFIAASALDRPFEHVCSACFTVGSSSPWKYWQKLQSKVLASSAASVNPATRSATHPALEH